MFQLSIFAALNSTLYPYLLLLRHLHHISQSYCKLNALLIIKSKNDEMKITMKLRTTSNKLTSIFLTNKTTHFAAVAQVPQAIHTTMSTGLSFITLLMARVQL